MDSIATRFRYRQVLEMFRIKLIRTDRDHGGQAKFHLHVEDWGMEHHYIKASSPQLNCKVERSYLISKRVFFQLLTYKDDVDLNDKPNQLEQFYNFDSHLELTRVKQPMRFIKINF